MQQENPISATRRRSLLLTPSRWFAGSFEEFRAAYRAGIANSIPKVEANLAALRALPDSSSSMMTNARTDAIKSLEDTLAKKRASLTCLDDRDGTEPHLAAGGHPSDNFGATDSKALPFVAFCLVVAGLAIGVTFVHSEGAKLWGALIAALGAIPAMVGMVRGMRQGRAATWAM